MFRSHQIADYLANWNIPDRAIYILCAKGWSSSVKPTFGDNLGVRTPRSECGQLTCVTIGTESYIRACALVSVCPHCICLCGAASRTQERANLDCLEAQCVGSYIVTLQSNLRIQILPWIPREEDTLGTSWPCSSCTGGRTDLPFK
jgi:hypothetical protein